MQTFIGRTIGPYRLLEEIGRGGMGVVYKAWQPSLNRFVVLKMLPESLLHDPKFLDRFQREAWVAARLSHPNIVAIYDAGAVGGLHYIAMEYMDGGTLEDRLMAGPLGLDAALKVLAQVADALDYAHAQGLIHRDIKPSNILFTSDGWVKVADFGIARPAESTRLTRTGVLLGTPEYMSPEQATGDAVDHRTDLYALGVVAYEMLTGRVPFQGTTPYAVLHAAIYQAPPLPREINPRLSPAVESVLLKALAKHPDQRFQSAKALVEALRKAGRETRTQGSAPVHRPSQRPVPTTPSLARPLITLLAAASVIVVATLAWLLFLLSGSERRPVMTLTQAMGPVIPTVTADNRAASSAEVGRQATRDGIQTPTTILVATPSDTPLPPTNPPQPLPTPIPPPTERPQPAPEPTLPMPPTPSFTPEPTPTPKMEAPPPASGGRIAFYSDRNGKWEVYVMNSDGSGQTNLSNNPADDWEPAWSPNGRKIAFVSNRDGNGEIYVMNADGGGQRNLSNHPARDWFPAWSSSGKIAFESQRDGNWEIYVMNADGSGQTRLTDHPADDMDPAWSPDGTKIVFYSTRAGNSEIYVMNADGSGLTRLTNHPADDWHPAWSPRGDKIVFESNRDGNWEIYIMNTDGSEVMRLTNHPADDLDPAWSPNGQQIVFSSTREGNADIFVMNSDGSGLANLTRHPSFDGWPAWSP